jgi:hypothetical protein
MSRGFFVGFRDKVDFYLGPHRMNSRGFEPIGLPARWEDIRRRTRRPTRRSPSGCRRRPLILAARGSQGHRLAVRQDDLIDHTVAGLDLHIAQLNSISASLTRFPTTTIPKSPLMQPRLPHPEPLHTPPRSGPTTTCRPEKEDRIARTS